MAELRNVVLALCPACKVALVVIDGTPQGKVTLFMRDGRPAVTPHADDCEYLGKETLHPREVAHG